MATIANILALMEMLDNQLETGSGEPDESRAILAITQAQHYFEMEAALMDFKIPPGTKKIEIHCFGTPELPTVEISDSAGIETSGYLREGK